MAYIDNDTLNIWTHLIAVFVYVALGFMWQQQIRDADRIDRDAQLDFWWYQTAYVVFAWTMSVTYHTMRCYSDRVFKVTLMGDLSAIIVVVMSFNQLTTAYELRCAPDYRDWWQSIHTMGALINVVLLPLYTAFGLQSLRTVTWLIYASTSLIVHMHREQQSGPESRNWLTFVALFSSYTMTVISLIVRNLKCPERLNHGVYDIVPNSHSIFHALVAIAPLPLLCAFHHVAVTVGFECEL